MSEKYFDALDKHIDAAKAFEAGGAISAINELTGCITKAMDEFILKQFERHGYSKEEITDLAVAGKLERVEHGTVITYIVNGLALFDIMRMEYSLTDADDDFYNFTAKLICQDLVPAVRGEQEG